ncbi:O-succinylbenzoate-CoA synthase [Mycolicibacterium duvalii]|uniref:O-succinylbenzoate synthase n=1 Tax=Mycolicibacterium duvalii TaxID=39688 RepID=A0A7I7JYE0_9MYCO|nr:O-succinylbenzoate-CoA synthase [Mycolicibacterium duvalii]MCV7369597.1 O-succinylbenzoate-CoA synthase [Mycolicibacterium duvalii]PEG42219.1 O-succinylbenzoate-CoA synthase [Mycolicibacterium duvalii]BBX16324.1 o-succinylbenzoate synthase [Mycolicibacterium duvalii]
MRTLIDFRAARVFAVPTSDGLRVGALVEGPQGWGEFSPPPDADDALAARWLTAAMEPSTVGWPDAVRGQVPVAAARIAVSPSSSGTDIEHVQAVADRLTNGEVLRCVVPVDDVEAAVRVIRDLSRMAPAVDIVELSCDSADSAEAVRSRVDMPVAVDSEVLARAARPAQAADAVILSSGPLGGVRRALRRAELTGLPALVNLVALTSIGVAGDVALAASVPDLRYPCGPVPSWLAEVDLVSAPRSLSGAGAFLPAAPTPASPDAARLARCEVTDPATLERWRALLQRAGEAR